ncbi:MAG: hypothetical protein WCH79_10660 [Planctomycetia bacterium]
MPSMFRSDIENAGAVEIGEDGDVVLSSPEALFVDADVVDGRSFPTLEAASHRPIHDRLDGIPAEAKHGSRRFHGAAGLQNFDGRSLEEPGESGVLTGPWRHDGLDTVLRASVLGNTGDQLRHEQLGVQVPPASLVRMIGEAACDAALWADHASTDVRQANLNAAVLDLEVNRLHPPGGIEAEQTGVMRLKGVHGRTLPNRQPPMNRHVRTTNIPVEPKNTGRRK